MSEVQVEIGGPVSSRSRKLRVLIGGREEQLDLGNGDQRRKVLKQYPGVTEADLVAALERYEAERAQEEAAEAPADPTVDPPATGWAEGAGSRKVRFETLGEALRADSIDYVRWEAEPGAVACVDVDLTREGKDAGGWAEHEVASMLRRSPVRPRYTWLSRSGGLHAIFGGCPDYGLSGAERAGLWILTQPEWVRGDWIAAVEEVGVTRTVPEGRILYREASEYGAADLRGALLRTGGREAATPAAIDDWLDEHGLQLLGRYDHTSCPWAPDLNGGRDPVEVTEEGIGCFRCGRRAGWAELCGEWEQGEALPVAIDMARNLVHWQHAEPVLHASYPAAVATGSRLLREGYRAALKVIHVTGDPEQRAKAEERVGSAFSRLHKLIRTDGSWLRSHTLRPADVISRASLAALPWTLGAPQRMDEAEEGGDLEGFVPIEPVRHLVDKPTLRGGRVYVRLGDAPSESPIPLAEALEELREALPGVSPGWLRAGLTLTVAGLRAQLGQPEPPMVIVEMPSGSGKGALVAFLGGIFGVPCQRVLFEGDQEECNRSVGTALEERAPIIWCDEVGKVSGFWAKSSSILTLTRTHTWRKLHHNKAVTAVRSAVLLAGSTLPRSLLTMSELNRRAVVLRWDPTPAEVTARWPASLQERLGVESLQDLRQSERGREIADAFTAEARRLVLVDDLPPWVVQGVELGGERVADSADMRDLYELAQHLYDAWVGAPDSAIEGGSSNRAGWLRCWAAAGPTGVKLAEILDPWLDEDDDARTRHARLAGPLETLALAGGLRISLRAKGTRVWVRFHSGASRSLERQDEALFPRPLAVRP